MNTLKIYERVYDNHVLPDDTKKPNKFLGEFEILQIIELDMYSSMMIGTLVGTDEIHLIDESEVCGYNGGSRFETHRLTFVDALNKEHNDQ